MPSAFPSRRRPIRLAIFTGIFCTISLWSLTIYYLASQSLLNHHLAQWEGELSNPIRLIHHVKEDRLHSLHNITGPRNYVLSRTRKWWANATSTTPSDSFQQPLPTSSFVFPLHAKAGTHHAYLYIGTPPQRQTLIVDTGSRLTAFPCYPHCPNCGKHASPQFDLNQSSSRKVLTCDECSLSRENIHPSDHYRFGLRGAINQNEKQWQRVLLPYSCNNNHCEINQRYTEGSFWTAYEVQDNVWLGSDETNESLIQHEKYSAPFVFGCQVSEEGLFQTQYADGIMGLSMYTQTLVSAWHENGSISTPSFSLCFHQEGGHMFLGGTASTFVRNEYRSSEFEFRHLNPMQFTPLVKTNTWYYTVMVTSISVGDYVLPRAVLKFLNSDKGTIVDSGTTDTFLSFGASRAFSIAWKKAVGRSYSNKLQQFTYEEFHDLPVIVFELEGGVQWDVRPDAYMEAAALPLDQRESAQMNGSDIDSKDRNEPWPGKRGFTSRIYIDEPQGAVLGANSMMDHDIYFDIENRRLGVARAACAY